MRVVDGHGLGCWLGANDPKSMDYLHRGTYQADRQTLVHRVTAPILDQDGIGGCVGFTDADVLNTAKFYRSRKRPAKRTKYLTDEYGYGFYRTATRLDEWTDEAWEPDDTGSSVLAGAKALKADGYIDRYEWAIDVNGFIAALQRQPVMLGTLWTDGMMDPDSSGLIRPTGDLAGGHAYMAYGLNLHTGKVKFRNHWTADWGVNGDFYMLLDDVEWLIAQQGEVLVPVPV
jgi:hypothetical protein